MEISIIIPSYKPGKYIWECMDSIYNQTIDKSRFEVILVLNGCNQPWRGQIENWLKTHPDLYVNFIQIDTPGVSNARNIALDAAKGEYITFVDDDDYVSASYLESLIQASDGKSVILSDSRAFVEGISGWKEDYQPHLTYRKCMPVNDQKLLHARAIFNGPCMKLIKMSFIQEIQFDTSLANGEDGLFMFQISRNVKHLAYASEDAIYFRRYRVESATTGQRSKRYWINNTFILLLKYICVWLSHPFSYNLTWAGNRVLSNLKALRWHLQNSKKQILLHADTPK